MENNANLFHHYFILAYLYNLYDQTRVDEEISKKHNKLNFVLTVYAILVTLIHGKGFNPGPLILAHSTHNALSLPQTA